MFLLHTALNLLQPTELREQSMFHRHFRVSSLLLLNTNRDRVRKSNIAAYIPHVLTSHCAQSLAANRAARTINVPPAFSRVVITSPNNKYPQIAVNIGSAESIILASVAETCF